MLTVSEALARCLTAVTPMPWERISLDGAHGRVLAEDIASPLDIPPWDNSAMDGFAVRAEDTVGVPVRLEVLETVGAGDVPTRSIEKGTCSRIMTGAPMPEGADAVVMVEQTDGGPQDRVEIRVTATQGQNIRDRGNDVAVCKKLGAGARHPLGESRRRVGAVGMLERKHETPAGVVVNERRAGTCERGLLTNARAAQYVCADRVCERNAASPADRLGNELDRVPTPRTQRARLVHDRLASQALGQQHHVERKARQPPHKPKTRQRRTEHALYPHAPVAAR